MEALKSATTLVHYYDTRLHEILCGVRGFEQRSTKHSRDVTCHACIELLGKRPTVTAPPAPEAPTDNAP